MDRSFGSRVALVVLTASAIVGAYYLHFFFLVENCYLGEDGSAVPALASTQGQFCGEPESPLNFVLFGFFSGAVLATILFVLSWRSARSWVGKLAAFIVPALVMGFTWGILALPSDTCSESEKQNEPSWRCATHMT